MRIGNIELKNNLILAPMAGVTDIAFRSICIDEGADYAVTEMISVKALEYRNDKTLELLRTADNEKIKVVQLFGSEPEVFAKVLQMPELSKFDIIDINMGCPVNKVAKKSGAGASLLRNPNNVYEIVKSVVEAVKKPVTVKIRLGWDNDSINCVENAKMIEKAGASAITIHARTRSQFYSGNADWKYIKEVVDSVNIPVIGNGDVIDYKTCKRMLDETGCQAVAIGRGSLGNPFIFRECLKYLEDGTIIDKPSNKEIYDTIIKHYNLLLDLKGEKIALLEMRNHISWYIKGKPGSAKIKDICNKETNFNEVLKILKNYLDV